jgi:hypothetical protein
MLKTGQAGIFGGKPPFFKKTLLPLGRIPADY